MSCLVESASLINQLHTVGSSAPHPTAKLGAREDDCSIAAADFNKSSGSCERGRDKSGGAETPIDLETKLT
jgi:hypothetical protein